MTEQDVLDILARRKAVITESHVVYTSGRHGSAYVHKDAIYPYTKDTSLLCRAMAERFVNSDVEVVIAPAVGGVILSQWTAFHLSELTGREVLSVYAEKSDDGETFIIKRGYDKLLPKKRVLVVEDVLTTGGSARKVVEAVRAIDGQVIGLGVLCNRGGITTWDVGDVPELFALLNVSLESWPEEKCPLCANCVPINTEVGKGREFLARQGG